LKRTTQARGAGSSVSGTSAPQAELVATTAADDAAVSVSNLSLHELFEQQARNMLDRADIDEEQKQSIMMALACPCCGAGGMSFSVKLRAEES
jgi:hypothetical protein